MHRPVAELSGNVWHSIKSGHGLASCGLHTNAHARFVPKFNRQYGVPRPLGAVGHGTLPSMAQPTKAQ